MRTTPEKTSSALSFTPFDKIFLCGHRGMVGSAILRALQKNGFSDIILRNRQELDLLDQLAVDRFFAEERPDGVILAAARVGGIGVNTRYPYEFLYENLQIQNNTMHAALKHGVGKFVFLGSSCIYPRECPQPMKEEYLMTGPLEPTNEGYALAKIAGLRLLQYLRGEYGMKNLSVMPCNLYGPNDTFDPVRAHVMAALVRKFVDARESGVNEVILWGTGTARREFLHVDDFARALMLLIQRWKSAEIVNIGCGEDVSIQELAGMVAKASGYGGKILWDSTKPDGMPRKCLDISKLTKIGFVPEISLHSGIEQLVRLYDESAV